MSVRADGGHKRWFVVSVTEEHRASVGVYGSDADGCVFLRMEPGVSFDRFDMATWFETRGRAMDAIDGDNLDINRLQLVQVMMNGDQIVKLPTAWT